MGFHHQLVVGDAKQFPGHGLPRPHRHLNDRMLPDDLVDLPGRVSLGFRNRRLRGEEQPASIRNIANQARYLIEAPFIRYETSGPRTSVQPSIHSFINFVQIVKEKKGDPTSP